MPESERTISYLGQCFPHTPLLGGTVIHQEEVKPLHLLFKDGPWIVLVTLIPLFYINSAAIIEELSGSLFKEDDTCERYPRHG